MASSLRELVVSVTVDSRRYQAEMQRVSRMGASYAQTFRQGSEQMTRGWNQQTAAARSHATAMQGASQALGRYAAVAASAFGVGQLAQVADSWTNISNRLRLVTDSSESFARAQADVLRIAQATRQPLDATAELYQRIAMNQDALGLSGQEMARVVETISKTMVISGTSAVGAQAALVQLGQAFASGTLRGEELNSVLEQAPALAQAIARGLDVPIGQLREMGKAGELSTQQLIAALQRQSGAVDEAFGSMEVTIGQAMTNLRTAFQVFVGQSADVSGASSAIAESLNLVARNMDAIATVGGAAAIGALAGKLVQLAQAGVVSAVQAIRSAVATRAEALATRDATMYALAKAQADVRKAQAAQVAARGTAESARQSRNLAAALLAERQATVAATAAQTAYARATSASAAAGRAALGLLGGPAGLAITVGMVAAGWLLFRDNSTEATRALQDMTGPLDEVLEKFRELGAAQQLQAIQRAEEAFTESVSAMRSAVANLNLNVGEGSLGAQFRQIDEDVRAGATSVEEGARRMTAALQEYLNTRDPGDRMRSYLIDQAARWEQNAQAAEQNRERVSAYQRAQETAAPAIDATTGAVNRNAEALAAAGKAAEEAGKKIQNAIRDLPGQIERIGKSAGQVARLDVRDWFRAEAAGGVNFNDRANPRVQELLAQGTQYIRLQEQLASAQEANTRATRAASQAESAATKAQRERERAAEQLLERYTELEAAQRREIALHGETGRAAALAYDAAHGALVQFSDAQKAVLQEQAEWLDWLDEMADIQRVQEEVAREVAGKQKEQIDRMTVFAEQAGRNIQTALGDSLYEILDGRFEDIGDSFANMLKRMAAELAASQLLTMLGGAMAGYGGQGTWGNLIRGIGGAMQTSGGRAGGGRVEAFKAYDIAEHGQPEVLSYGGRNVLIMGAQGGMVSPLMNAKGGGTGAAGGAQPQINVQIIKGANEDRVESSQAPGGGMNLRIMLKTASQGMFANGEMDGVMRSRYGLVPRGVAGG